ncbi:glycan-binding surface protein [Mucilaginibacter sp. UR6-1]|uniref:glycan-binding surface protein n=1 Tax=Mucilaginibacter sp. UR6-1 TaxID=1435643 RepID=UPI001E3D86F1|nr:glycan-binding surface protein [Mucilaginibacter sp. UR6-1]MCC8411272.1 glycan-binding surface protein [Mucilaginibacter sp. UR6-1]
MKKIFKALILLIVAALTVSIYSSCSKNDNNDGGTPTISYIRITDPNSSDSLLVSAGQGNLIAIVGTNLQNAREIWFNDRKAIVTTTYVTSTSILVSVPSEIPVDITNKIKIVFSDGKTLEHDFTVSIAEPQISYMDCEYVPAGEIATINGNYFYQPLTVTFTGGAEAEIESITDAVIKVRVPAGAQPGPITVKTNFGETKSDLFFRDNRNIILSSDPFTGWWNASFVVSSPGPDDPIAINGNYIRVKRVIGAWGWTEVAGGPPDAMGPISKNIPDAAILKPEDYNLKFEVNTVKPYNNNMIRFNFGLSDFNNDAYLWNPPIDTKGKWQTITIPFDEYADSFASPLTVRPNGYYTRILLLGPGELDADISFDNFRVVPKVNKD